MAHKTLIDGTAYSISGGKALVDGTAYKIKSGKTLVGGTAYSIEFGGGDMATITFGDMSGGYVEIDGVRYAGSNTTVNVPLGTTIVCSASFHGCDNDACKTGSAYIYLNNSQVNVAVGYYAGAVTYSYTVNGNISIYTTQTIKECSECEKGDITRSYLYITEE